MHDYHSPQTTGSIDPKPHCDQAAVTGGCTDSPALSTLHLFLLAHLGGSNQRADEHWNRQARLTCGE